MSVSIATKQPTKRARKLILRGDHGKHARNDNSHVYREKDDPKPMLGIRGGVILHSSAEDLDHDSTTPVLSQLVHTTESSGFTVKPPTHRRRVRNQRRSQAVKSTIIEPRRFDSAGRPIIVVNDCDAWWLCGRSRGHWVS